MSSPEYPMEEWFDWVLARSPEEVATEWLLAVERRVESMEAIRGKADRIMYAQSGVCRKLGSVIGRLSDAWVNGIPEEAPEDGLFLALVDDCGEMLFYFAALGLAYGQTREWLAHRLANESFWATLPDAPPVGEEAAKQAAGKLVEQFLGTFLSPWTIIEIVRDAFGFGVVEMLTSNYQWLLPPRDRAHDVEDRSWHVSVDRPLAEDDQGGPFHFTDVAQLRTWVRDIRQSEGDDRTSAWADGNDSTN